MSVQQLLNELSQLVPNSVNVFIKPFTESVDLHTGAMKRLKSQYNSADERLKEARSRYLEAHALDSHIEALIQKAASVASAATPAEPDINAMTSKGLRNHINKYMSLEKHRQVVLAAQRLSITTSPSPVRTGTAGTAHSNADIDIAGTDHQLLGVGPRAIINRHLPDWRKAERLHKDLLPELEASISSTVAVLEQDLPALAPADMQEELQCPPEGELLLELEQRKQARSKEVLQELGEQLRYLVDAATEYLQLLDDLHQWLVLLVRDDLLRDQKQLDDINCEYFTSLVECLREKAQAAVLTVMRETYSREDCIALFNLKETLTEAMKAAQDSISAMTNELAAYTNLGPEFSELLSKFRDIKIQRDHLDAQIKYGNDLGMELDDMMEF